MKRLLLMFLLCYNNYLCTQMAAQVSLKEDFQVSAVVERLDEHMANVESWYAISKRCAKKASARVHAFDMHSLRTLIEVAHPAMIQCFNEMEYTQSLDPFFALWQQFKNSYEETTQDRLLCKEVAFIATHLYNTMLCQLQRSTTRVTVPQMLELYHAIASLPIYELLALLDSIAREIVGLLDQTYQGEDSFFIWLWHNWWVPPTVISHALSSFIEGLATIMTQQKPSQPANAKEDGKKSLSLRAYSH